MIDLRVDDANSQARRARLDVIVPTDDLAAETAVIDTDGAAAMTSRYGSSRFASHIFPGGLVDVVALVWRKFAARLPLLHQIGSLVRIYAGGERGA